MLSGQILHYPVPVLINWGAPESENAYVQHLAKIETILNYLDKLEQTKTAHDDDLILVLDAWDAWLQLPSEVLIKRYFEVVGDADARSKGLYGRDARHTILFGPDKICWPIDFSRPACWAVPQVPLEEGAFGPPSSRDEANMPRWLNSGTIMGPLSDMQDMFRATLEQVTKHYSTDSDQFYFANVWGYQEYARLAHDPSRLQSQMEMIDAMERWEDPTTMPHRSPADLEPGERSDYHIAIDYLSSLFQTLAFYKRYLTFMRADHSWIPSTSSPDPHAGSSRYGFTVPEDLAAAPPPYSDLKSLNELNDRQRGLLDRTWDTIELCVNTITAQVPVTLHFTGEKALRALWWEKIWYQSHARLLRTAALKAPEKELNGGLKMSGRVWRNGVPINGTGARGGAVGDQGEPLGWTRLCGKHEEQVFGNQA